MFFPNMTSVEDHTYEVLVVEPILRDRNTWEFSEFHLFMIEYCPQGLENLATHQLQVCLSKTQTLLETYFHLQKTYLFAF